jgi:large subunit ribosomal protein L29
MKAKELKQKTAEELAMMLKEDHEKIRVMRFDLASKKLKNTNELSNLKKQVAQILTIVKEKNN